MPETSIASAATSPSAENGWVHTAGRWTNPFRDLSILCYGRTKVYGKDRKGKQRRHCPTCGYTFTVGVSTRGTRTNRLPDEKHQKILDLLKQGHTLRFIAQHLGVERHTVRARKREGELVTGIIHCPCGKLSGHQGWCKWRISQSPARQEYLARVTRAPKPKSPQTPITEYYPFLSGGEQDTDLVMRVNEIVPKNLPHEMRADICQDILLDLLSGVKQLEDFRGSAGSVREYITSYYKRYKERFGTLSIDHPMRAGGDERTLAEKISDLSGMWQGGRESIEFRDRHGKLVQAQRSDDVSGISLVHSDNPRVREPRPRYIFRPRVPQAKHAPRRR